MSEIEVDARILRLEQQREVLLNALCEAVRIITGNMPQVHMISHRFLESGELPKLSEDVELRDQYPLAEASFQTVNPADRTT